MEEEKIEAKGNCCRGNASGNYVGITKSGWVRPSDSLVWIGEIFPEFGGENYSLTLDRIRSPDFGYVTYPLILGGNLSTDSGIGNISFEFRRMENYLPISDDWSWPIMGS